MRAAATIIIPNWNGTRWLPGCLSALARQTVSPAEVIVVDNGSQDDSLDTIAAHPLTTTIISLEQNRGFAYAVNRGIEKAQTEYVVLLNNDTAPNSTWLEKLVNSMEEAGPRVYAVGSLMLSMQDPSKIDDAGNSVSWYGAATKRLHQVDLSSTAPDTNPFSVSAGATVYRKAALAEIGPFDEDFESYLEDIDLGIRAKLHAWTCRLCPDAIVLHQAHGSDLPHNTYIRLITCNRLALFWKYLPLKWLIKKSPHIIYGQIYFLIAYGRPLASLSGYLRFFRRAWKFRKNRRQVRSATDWEVLFSKEPLDPPLSHFLNGYWRSLIKWIRRA